MRVANKINLTVLIVLLIVAMVIAGIGWNLLEYYSNKQVEREVLTQVEATEVQLQKNEKALLAAVHDWAWWDDTYNFMADRNDDYKNDTMNYPTLVTLQINAVVYTDDKGEIVLSRGANLQTRQATAVDDSILKDFFAFNSVLTMVGANSVVGFVKSKDGKLILLASDQIRRNGGEQPTNGRLCFMRFIDEYNQLDLTTSNLVASQLVSLSDGSLPLKIVEALRSGKNNIMDKETEGKITVYRIVNNIYGDADFCLKSQVDVTGVIWSKWRSIAVFATVLLFVVVVWLIFVGFHWLHIGRRWQSLEDFIQTLLYTRNYNQRIQVRGQDDLADVSETLNDILNAIHRRHVKMQQQLSEQEHIIAELQIAVEGKAQAVSTEACQEKETHPKGKGVENETAIENQPPADFAAVLAAARALNNELGAERNALLE